jgi:hypothetical protein
MYRLAQLIVCSGTTRSGVAQVLKIVRHMRQNNFRTMQSLYYSHCHAVVKEIKKFNSLSSEKKQLIEPPRFSEEIDNPLKFNSDNGLTHHTVADVLSGELDKKRKFQEAYLYQ